MIGTSELMLAAVAVAGISLRPRSRRWAMPVAVCLVIAMVFTPPDPTTLVMAAMPLIAAFVAGVRFAPLFRRTHGAA